MREVRCRVVVGSAKELLFVLGSVVTGIVEICNRPLVLDEIRWATTALLQCLREVRINRLGEYRTPNLRRERNETKG